MNEKNKVKSAHLKNNSTLMPQFVLIFSFLSFCLSSNAMTSPPAMSATGPLQDSEEPLNATSHFNVAMSLQARSCYTCH